MYPKILINPGKGHDNVELQKSYDTDLNTEDKTVTGAINTIMDALLSLGNNVNITKVEDDGTHEDITDTLTDTGIYYVTGVNKYFLISINYNNVDYNSDNWVNPPPMISGDAYYAQYKIGHGSGKIHVRTRMVPNYPSYPDNGYPWTKWKEVNDNTVNETELDNICYELLYEEKENNTVYYKSDAEMLLHKVIPTDKTISPYYVITSIKNEREVKPSDDFVIVPMSDTGDGYVPVISDACHTIYQMKFSPQDGKTYRRKGNLHSKTWTEWADITEDKEDKSNKITTETYNDTLIASYYNGQTDDITYPTTLLVGRDLAELQGSLGDFVTQLYSKEDKSNKITYESTSGEPLLVLYDRGELTDDQYISAKALGASLNITHNAAMEATNIAKGANQALSFDNYSAFCEWVRELATALPMDYNIGQVFLIKTLDVPDLWLYVKKGNGDFSTIPTDEEILENLKTNGYFEFGHCKFAALETQKVDLTEYATKSEVGDIEAALDSIIALQNQYIGGDGV